MLLFIALQRVYQSLKILSEAYLSVRDFITSITKYKTYLFCIIKLSLYIIILSCKEIKLSFEEIRLSFKEIRLSV